MALPPLVDPVAELPADELVRAARQLKLPELGELAQRRLFAAKVGVLGAGGLGSPVLLYLASAGVGTIGIVDDDTVDITNLQRQVIFGTADVGQPKATVAARRIRELSPHTRVIEHRERLTPANAETMLGGYDLIIDGSDSFDTRYAVADACAAIGVPLVWGSVLRFDAQATVFWSKPPAGPAVTLRDVFPTPPAAGEVPSCAEAGVLGALCGQLGGILAAEAVKLICGAGDSLLGRMLVLDALSMRMREVPLAPTTRRVPDAAPASPGRPAVSRIGVDELDALSGATLLDVREPHEFARGSIPGAVSLPLSGVLGDPASVTVDGTLVVFCQEGPRARAAARALAAAHPGADIRVLDGGYAEWSSRSRA
ncbi:adenylyltransferase and sulfurtransferase [Paramicrobacterium humi]|uniref:Adenylyltransferase and sulfurtransferase n=1 Tax=Paramicrobacterium humi TaxID=640635 RepID=A0A1H4N1S0_9MICO|nr:ThiF family adenylyltransferase [Microbacterium humi]SEB88685.1 adenylyltransferase and sulfurtransferase [Microbacterium humi]